jgi:hypothetical protein
VELSASPIAVTGAALEVMLPDGARGQGHPSPFSRNGIESYFIKFGKS